MDKYTLLFEYLKKKFSKITGDKKMRLVPSVICPRCESYIGELDKLEDCPICGYEFVENLDLDEEN